MCSNQVKKLVLHLDTIRKLTGAELEHVEGGKRKVFTAGPDCYYDDPATGDPCAI